ncbi:MAG: hypothetical protein MUC88_10145 [Planctomycetes bacterium]|jgi:hypothetical protein|nr:hypothetical protein [Planctomycetota bacterium]
MMNLTQRQKTLAAVCLIGLVGLVIDRTILRPQGGPRAASADTPGAGRSQPGTTAPPAEEPPARVPIAERLNRLVPAAVPDSNERRNPFALPVSWSDSGAAHEAKVPDPATVFIRQHRLKAVAVQGTETGALVDDSFLALGQSVDGFTLVAVGHREAVFEREGRQAVLELTLP